MEEVAAIREKKQNTCWKRARFAHLHFQITVRDEIFLLHFSCPQIKFGRITEADERFSYRKRRPFRCSTIKVYLIFLRLRVRLRKMAVHTWAHTTKLRFYIKHTVTLFFSFFVLILLVSISIFKFHLLQQEFPSLLHQSPSFKGSQVQGTLKDYRG